MISDAKNRIKTKRLFAYNVLQKQKTGHGRMSGSGMIRKNDFASYRENGKRLFSCRKTICGLFN